MFRTGRYKWDRRIGSAVEMSVEKEDVELPVVAVDVDAGSLIFHSRPMPSEAPGIAVVFGVFIAGFDKIKSIGRLFDVSDFRECAPSDFRGGFQRDQIFVRGPMIPVGAFLQSHIRAHVSL